METQDIILHEKLSDDELNEEHNKCLNAKKNIPPVVGEYGYYDTRLLNKNPHWLINADRGCHYSLNILMGHQPYITCHGKIERINKKVDNTKRTFIKFSD